MDDPHESPPQKPEKKNVLPDVVHSQQILAAQTGDTVGNDISKTDSVENADDEDPSSQHVEDDDKTETISEHIPSKLECSITETESTRTHDIRGLLKPETYQEQTPRNSSFNIQFTHSSISDNRSEQDPSKQSTVSNIGESEIHHISDESPVNLALSLDLSKDKHESESQILVTPQPSEHKSLEDSPRSDKYLDSLTEESTHKSDVVLEEDNSLEKLNRSTEREQGSPEIISSDSEEIIKLDIRGRAAPKMPFPAAKIIFGPPPQGSTVIDPNIEPIPVFQTLLSPFLVGVGDTVKVEEVFDDLDQVSKDLLPDKSAEMSQSSFDERLDQSDLLVEEVFVDYELKEKQNENHEQDTSIPVQPKSLAPEETTSFSTLSTDYKTICEEYHVKLVHLEDAIMQRDQLIEELTISLQRSVSEREILKSENIHLTNEVQNLQHIVGERTPSDHDTIKAQLSDFIKYQSMVKDDSTKFYSALMSEGSSIQSSTGEKDVGQEEITVNYSKSDLKSSDDEFQTEFEQKLTNIMSKFEECIEENIRNKLRESMIQILCDEIGKLRIESDTEVKEIESQMQRDKQAYSVETRKLRELLASVKAGNADINVLRQELDVKHEKEMENLRTYFEKKCSDMERSYSEAVWRGRSCASPGSTSSLDAADIADTAPRRRARSADPPSITLESNQMEQAIKQTTRKLEDLKGEHVAYVNELQARHREAIEALEEQITELKAHIQTAENTEANVSVYQQDIDLELEKKTNEQIERKLDEVRQEVIQQLQEQIQVLLSDPDAELSSWPLELVALRDKIHADVKPQQDKEVSSIREELSVCETDKWKQRRNHSFDQNRHLEEVTKERDGLKRVAANLHCAVGQLLAYCAAAEDELNRTVLAKLLGHLLPVDETIPEEDITPNLSATELNSSALSKSGKRVHFAPDLKSVLAGLDEEALASYLQQQRDVSSEVKKELEVSLRRLRQEAHELLELSERVGAKGVHDVKEPEADQVHITELVEELDSRQISCDNCELHRKHMEEAMSECLQRENLLRSDLADAMYRIAQLMAAERQPSTDLIAEGYGTCQQLQHPLSLPARPPSRPRPSSESGATSLDGATSPRGHLMRMAHELDSLQRERDDLHQQLEAANRQLRSTRQFVEEQATEREAERDEFARRLAELREENSALVTRLQKNARILNEVEQLEAQTREMNQIILELETRKASTDEELKASTEKIAILRDIIANLESQLEQKTAHEFEILEQLEGMKKTIDERDSKMRGLLGELESLRNERAEQSDVTCAKCTGEENRYDELLDKIKEQTRWLEEHIHRRTQKIERIHEVCSTSCSEPSEDVSLRDQKNPPLEAKSPERPPHSERLPELLGVWECLEGLARAEDAALKRVADLEMQRAQLKDIAQEVRAERDVLQARMSEQALRVSSLAARLDQQRHSAEALAHNAASHLTVQLHDALAEVQRLKEELESKDKQLTRMKHNLEEKHKQNEQQHTLYGNSCNPKDKVIILERELSSAQNRIAQLEGLVRSLETNKEEMQSTIREHQRALAEKEEQLQELLVLKLDDVNQKEEKSDIVEGAKISGRTLSDIVSISEFDEQDLQMRRAELKAQNLSISGGPYTEIQDKTPLNKTVPPDLQKANMSSLNLDYVDNFDLPSYTPRADSLPAHLTSTQNKDILKKYKRNGNETTVFGTVDKSAETKNSIQKIQDNCSMYPNRDASDTKNVTVEPKKIDFSLEPSKDNRSRDDEEFTSLRELGITLDIRQENFPDILTQLKHEIKKSRTELENCKSELKNAEEQLCEFPALKEEVEELKGLLENTMATMENDKKFYENQLENFSSNKKLLEQRLAELSQEVNDKSKDLHLLKEDILRRENMILELAKEKRNLTNKMAELEVKIDELQSRNTTLEKYESENRQLKERVSELQKLEQLVSEKNQQIDSLNQHLDRLDDLQRCLNDKTEEFENLKEAFEEKSNELFQMQDTVESLNRDMTKVIEENNTLNNHNRELKIKLTKLEKEQENASLKLQNSESELERVNSINGELTSKLEELKELTDKLKDKETEIEILNEDINSFHEEIASLKEQLKMVSRSPSPRSKNGEDKKSPDRPASSDKKHLVKIRKQISLLQHELDFNKKELNDKAFELAKAKLDVTELRNNLSHLEKQSSDAEATNAELRAQLEQTQDDAQRLHNERQHLAQQLDNVLARLREESNITELKAKLDEKVERCQELESELQEMRELVERLRSVPEEDQRALVVSGTRSPTAELERALRDQLDYSHRLDEHIMEQILSGSSDEREDIPRLALNTSKSSSSIQSSSSDRVERLRADNDKLQLQVSNLEARLKDKDALITELNRIRDKLVQDWQAAKLRYEAERDTSTRLQLLLDTHKETAESLQSQDSNMIQILKKRLESSMQAELELQHSARRQKQRLRELERQLQHGGDSTLQRDSQLQHELEEKERLKGELSLLKSKLEAERTRLSDLQALFEHSKLQLQRDLDAKAEQCSALRTQLAELRRLKHDAGVELLRAKELINTQSATISELEKKLSSLKHRPITDALTEIEGHKTELAREMATLKKCIAETANSSNTTEIAALREERQRLLTRVQELEKSQERARNQEYPPEEKDQAIRYLHGRCLRLESWRKALVWQKRYLQRELAGYAELERSLRLPSSGIVPVSTGRRRFKCVATAVVIVMRMGYLVRRRRAARSAAASCVLRVRTQRHDESTHSPQPSSNSPPCRDRPATLRSRDSLARRVLRNEAGVSGIQSPSLSDFVRRSPFGVNSTHEDPFILSSPRGEMAAGYLNKLELVSRCLNQAMDSPRDVP